MFNIMRSIVDEIIWVTSNFDSDLYKLIYTYIIIPSPNR